MKVKVGNMEMDLTLPFTLKVGSSTKLEFEHPVGIVVETEGKVSTTGNCYIRASSLETEKEATLQVEPLEIGEKELKGILMSKVKRPRGSVEKAILEILEGEMTPQQIANRTGVSLGSVYSALKRLEERKLVTRTTKGYRKVGVSVPKDADRNREVPVIG